MKGLLEKLGKGYYKVMTFNIAPLSTSGNIIKSVEEFFKGNYSNSFKEHIVGGAKAMMRGGLVGGLGAALGSRGDVLLTAGFASLISILDVGTYCFRSLGLTCMKKRSEEDYQNFIKKYHNPDFSRKVPQLVN